MAAMGDVGRAQGQRVKRQASSQQNSSASLGRVHTGPPLPTASPLHVDVQAGFAEWNAPYDLLSYSPHRIDRRAANSHVRAALPAHMHPTDTGRDHFHDRNLSTTRDPANGGNTFMHW